MLTRSEKQLSDGSSLAFVFEATCYIESDGVRGRPSPQRLVRLKPEVVLARVAQLDDPDLD